MKTKLALGAVLLLTSGLGSSSEGPVRPRPVLPPGEPDGAAAYYLARRSTPDGREVNLFDRYERARRHLERMPRFSTPQGVHRRRPVEARSAAAGWEPLGPGNIGGRTRALLIHPDDPEILYTAGVSGGIWKTEDGGQHWRPLADFLPNLAVSALAMDPDDPSVLYAGTGEGHFRELVRGTGLPLRGAGIFRSEDAGESWRRLAATATEDFHWVNDLIVSHVDSRRLYAATRSGVWRSLDAGASWSRVLASGQFGGCFDLVQRTDRSADALLASCGTFAQASIFRNEAAEGAQAWESVFTEFGMGRTSLAIAPSDQDVVYALSASYVDGPGGNFNGGLHAVFRSLRGGEPFSWSARVRNTHPVKLNTVLLSNPVIAHLEECELGTSRFSNLGWYTNVIAVDPLDPEVVWAGGVDLFRSDDGAVNWGPVSYWFSSPPSAHADQHAIAFHPGYDGQANQTFFVAGDGGVWRSDNARAARPTGPTAVCDSDNGSVRWTSLNHNLGITQFYHGAPFPDGSRYLGGTQDNGTLLGHDAAGSDGWDRIWGGDGGYVAVNPRDPDVVYAESQGLALVKSTDGGQSFESAIGGIDEPRNNFLFIVPFTMDPSEPERLWIGGRTIWRTDDGASSWTKASPPLTGSARISAIAVAPSDPQRVVAGSDQGFVYRQDAALSAGPASPWPASRPRSGFVSWLAFDPEDPAILYATYAGFGGGHAYKSANGGIDWVSLDGEGDTGLPDIPVHAIVIDPERTDRLYLATDLGVLVSDDGGLNWAVEINGFPNTVTESLTLLGAAGGQRNLFAFTHGRGAWRTSLSRPLGPPPCEPQRWLVHVTPPDAPFTTTILATNFGTEVQTVQMIPYLEDGTRLATVPLEVPAGESAIRLSTELFGADDVSHLGVCGDASVALSAAYRITSIVGASAHVRETSLVDTEFLFYPGERGIVFDGMALVNLGGEPAEVAAVQLDAGGRELERVTLNAGLPPLAKQLAVFDAEFEVRGGSAIRIESSQPSTLLLLRGTRPPGEPMLLYETAPIAVTARR